MTPTLARHFTPVGLLRGQPGTHVLSIEGFLDNKLTSSSLISQERLEETCIAILYIKFSQTTWPQRRVTILLSDVQKCTSTLLL
jgi:hypothetical protein